MAVDTQCVLRVEHCIAPLLLLMGNSTTANSPKLLPHTSRFRCGRQSRRRRLSPVQFQKLPLSAKSSSCCCWCCIRAKAGTHSFLCLVALCCKTGSGNAPAAQELTCNEKERDSLARGKQFYAERQAIITPCVVMYPPFRPLSSFLLPKFRQTARRSALRRRL